MLDIERVRSPRNNIDSGNPDATSGPAKSAVRYKPYSQRDWMNELIDSLSRSLSLVLSLSLSLVCIDIV